MSNNVHYTQVSQPQLLDIVDEAWLKDKLPDDSELQQASSIACSWFIRCIALASPLIISIRSIVYYVVCSYIPSAHD